MSMVVSQAVRPTPTDQCPSCHGEMTNGSAERFCSGCGLVDASAPPFVSEFSGFTESYSIPGRTLHGRMYGTLMSITNRDANGRLAKDFRRVRIADRRYGRPEMGSHDVKLGEIVRSRIQVIGDVLPIPVRTRALLIYTRLAANKKVRRWSAEWIIDQRVVLTLMAAARELGFPLSWKSLERASGLTHKRVCAVAFWYSALARKGLVACNSPPPEAFVSKFVILDGWSSDRREAAMDLARRYMASGSPMSRSNLAVAVGAMRLVSEGYRSVEHLARLGDVSAPTIRSQAKLMADVLGLEWKTQQ